MWKRSTLLHCVSQTYFPFLMYYSEKKLPPSLIWFRSDDLNACKPGAQCLQIGISSSFLSLFLFLQEQFLIHSPPPIPLGLICIISPKSAARYSGITLHDGWIWAKAAVRTGYLVNVLSRTGPGKREEERQSRWERKRRREKGRGEQKRKWAFSNTVTTSIGCDVAGVQKMCWRCHRFDPNKLF